LRYDGKTNMRTTVELEKMRRMLSLFEALAIRLKSPDNSPGRTEAWLNSAAQPASHAIINIDERGNVIFCNRSAEAILNFSANDVLGKPITSIIPENDIPYESLI